MNKQNQQTEGPTAAIQPMPTRRDLASAEIVEKGIALQALCGTKSAAEFLKFRMIAIDVVIRVLSRRSERRNGRSKIHADPVFADQTFRPLKKTHSYPSRPGASSAGRRH
jgi:hypothetical protein